MGFGATPFPIGSARTLMNHPLFDALPAAEFPPLPVMVAGGVMLWAIFAR